MFAKQMHTKRDHADDRSLNITHQQRVGIHRAVRAAPLQPGLVVIDISASFSPEKVIRVNPNRQRAVDRLVRQERVKLYQAIVHCIDLDGRQGSMQRLADEMSIVKLIHLHNSLARIGSIQASLLWFAVFAGCVFHVPYYLAFSHQHGSRQELRLATARTL
jgi:hypothetical protein